MALSSRIGIGIAVAGACSGLLLVGTLEFASAHRDGGRPVLIERTDCRPTAAASAAPEAAPAAVHQRVRVVVPPTARIRVDERGRILSAATNTGCAPRRGDDLYLIHADGSIEAALTGACTRVRWTGDFTVVGAFVDQAASGATGCRGSHVPRS